MKISAKLSPNAKPWDIDCSNDPVLTKQEFADDADVNVIIARCVKSNLPLPSLVAEPLFADVSEIGSYEDCVRRVQAGNDAFMNLSADLRTEFDNSPGNLIAFLGQSDPVSIARSIELGLRVAKPVDPAASAGSVPAVPVVVPASVAPVV